ncbi:lipid IV(A) 3-deoxy-D-manno-octulosonic acid transferase [Aggregatibacter actinomycetemcomitans]|uniref:lipid IV(A) 3-deoxy-D-manno-octulosonic acid transferase n=1 Tax=Aggregatibacter actinomycetemcomitans TaxID=714 RepID=UPI0011DD90B4|nr:lipid IV(A) 3-deoxy-D-manno-octulosonic acid transferase [Aggregatibacter actinomycetemcomitans]QEH44821.1 3-deoxy-D-manno-octulosonic acid transferase [Aggregatibacter actinomycetemcomitans]QEH48891.1 3-deoxy-D-manno-octulosonic acid transferase [Aggregatibacter actinomycetemcomitans]
MLRFFYTCLMYLVQPFLWLSALFRGFKAPNYRKRLGERYAFYGELPAPKPNGVLIHAASVGEVIAAVPLIKRIQQDYPHLAITVTTMTPTGSDRVKAVFGESVTHVYLPYDLPDAVARFIRFVQPRLVLVIETELWFNLIHHLSQRKIPFIIVNARLSARSAKRYGWFKNKLKPLLDNITLIAPQDDVSLVCYAQLGIAPERLMLTGNIKYDLNLTDDLLNNITALKAQWNTRRPIWIAASTHEGEDEIILKSHRTLLAHYPDLLLILVPRHPERFNSVAQLIEQQGFHYIRRSSHAVPQAETQVLLGDTMGELMLLYGMANVALVGGSLVAHGGHNPLEPLAFKLPVISGKHTFNFPEVFGKLIERQGVVITEDSPQAVAETVAQFLSSPTLGECYGNAGYAVLNENRGALQRVMDLLKPYLDEAN